MVEEPSSSSIPARVGRFEVLRLLQEGGMGRLYVARHPTLNQEVVLKTLTARARRHGTAAIARLRQEAEILAKLHHDGLCPVLDFFEEDGEQYVVLPFIPGEDLAVRIARAARIRERGGTLADAWNALFDEDDPAPTTPRGLRRILELMEALARAIHVAHEGAVVHRDLKPSNVIIRADGRPVVLDFGVALDRESAAPAITEGHSTPGTIFYMSPEQLRGRRADVDRRSDVYSLGAVLYEMLTLRRAIGATETDAAIAQILGGYIDRPRRGAEEIPLDVEAVCMMALEQKPARRYASALELAEDLRRCIDGRPTVARPLTPLTRGARWVRRNPILSAMGTLTIVAAIAAAIGLTLFSGERAHGQKQLDEVTDQYAFVGETLLLAADDGGISDDRLRRLREILGDEYVERLLVSGRIDGRQFRDVLARIRSSTRGGVPEDVTFTPLSPVGGVLGDRPVFRFRIEQLARPNVKLEVAVDLEEGERVIGTAVARTAGETLEVVLPDDVRLKPGVTVDWCVRPVSADDLNWWKTLYPRFTPVDPARHAAALRALRKTGNAGVDALLRATACLSLGLGQAALDELAMAPSDARLERQHLMLEAQARQMVGDVDGAATIAEKLFPQPQ